jgi:hypothetical protein
VDVVPLILGPTKQNKNYGTFFLTKKKNYRSKRVKKVKTLIFCTIRRIVINLHLHLEFLLHVQVYVLHWTQMLHWISFTLASIRSTLDSNSLQSKKSHIRAVKKSQPLHHNQMTLIPTSTNLI